MTIRNRLKKIEDKQGITEINCQCFPQSKTEIYLQPVGIAEPELITDKISETCPKCRKPILKQSIIIQGVEPQNEYYQ